MKKRILSTILAVMLMTSMLAGITASADVTTAPSVHVQEKVVYHETFEKTPGTDFELNSYYKATYEDRGDGNGNALVYTTENNVEQEHTGAWLRFLHNAAGDGRKLTLYKYMEDCDITEVSVDLYTPAGRNQSVNISNADWQWKHSINISSNGYAYYPDWELVNNSRTVNWENSETKDIHKLSKEFAKSCGWMENYVTDFQADMWHTIKFVFDNKSNVVTAYVDDKIVGRRVHDSTWAKPGLLTVEDESTATKGDVMFKVDNLKIVQKNLAPITEMKWEEDFSTTTSFDTSKHWKSWWAEPKVVATGDAEHGNALSLDVYSGGTRPIVTNDEFGVRFLVQSSGEAEGYTSEDLSVIEADFKLPARRRMGISVITKEPSWHYHSVIISENDWACFTGNQGNPSVTSTNAHKWQTQTMQALMTANSAATVGHTMGFPVVYGSDWNDVWHNVRFVKDKVNKTLTAYLDGISLGTKPFDATVLGLAFTSQTNGVAVGAQQMLVDNVRIGSVSNLGNASVALTKADGTAAESVTAGETYYAKMNGIENNTSEDKKMQLFVVAYDGNGSMLDIDCYSYTIPANTELSSDGEALSAVKLTAPTDAATMKVFAWSDFDTIVPLCGAAVK